MDTEWFAVDRDGCVGFFRSREAGAVPEAALSGGAANQALQRLSTLLPRVEVLHDRQGRCQPHPTQRQHHDMYLESFPTGFLMFVASLDVLREDIAAGRAVPVGALEGAAVLWPTLSAARYAELHAAGTCQGCSWWFQQIEEGLSEHGGRLGLFSYTHLTENWISGPYGRIEVPRQPIHVDQLPPDLRRLVKGLRLDDLTFRETTYIQPIEHAACASWESAYLDVTCKRIRPVPGKENEYADAYSEMRDYTTEFEVELPPEAPDEDA
jgi:hypothetical protein